MADRTLLKVRGIERASNDALVALISIADQLQFDPDWLATIIAFETGGSWDPAEPNKAGSGATGLIQFMPSTARLLSTTTAALASMTDAEQMTYVGKYFTDLVQLRPGRIQSLNDLYMAVLYPDAIGRSDSYVLFDASTDAPCCLTDPACCQKPKPSYCGVCAYAQNKGLDGNGDQVVTKAEAAAAVRSVYNAAGGARIAVLDAAPASPCEPNQLVYSGARGERTCVDCPIGSWPSADGSTCYCIAGYVLADPADGAKGCVPGTSTVATAGIASSRSPWVTALLAGGAAGAAWWFFSRRNKGSAHGTQTTERGLPVRAARRAHGSR